MLKKLVVAILILSNVFIMTGCWNYVEVDEQLTVSGIAVDKGQKGKKYHLTAEFISGGGGKDAQMETETIEADGDTIIEAIRSLMTTGTKMFYFGHCKLIIISDKVAKKGIADILDTIIRDREIRVTMNIVIAKHVKAKDILMSQDVSNPIISYEIVELIKVTREYNGQAPVDLIYQAFNSLNSVGSSTVLPSVELVKDKDKSGSDEQSNNSKQSGDEPNGESNTGPKAKEYLRISGVCVFKKDKMIGTLDEKDTKFLSFITNKVDKALITVEEEKRPNDYISFEVSKSKSKIMFDFKENTVDVKVKVKTEVSINASEKLKNYMYKSDTSKTQKNLEHSMKYYMERLIKHAQIELHSDIFGFGTQIHSKHPKQWKKYKDDWDEIFKKMNVDVDCEVTIKGSGIAKETAND